MPTPREHSSLLKKIGKDDLERIIRDLKQDADVLMLGEGITSVVDRYKSENIDLADVNFVHRYDASYEPVGDRDLPRMFPDAPFKGDLWIQLGMKRMIKYAIDNDFDAISWARADQIASVFFSPHEPLRQTYDSKIPKFMSAYARRLWGAELEKTHVVEGDPEQNSILYITPEMRQLDMQQL